MKKRFVLPKKITLPGGFVIRIQEIEMEIEEDAEFSYNLEGTALISIR